MPNRHFPRPPPISPICADEFGNLGLAAAAYNAGERRSRTGSKGTASCPPNRGLSAGILGELPASRPRETTGTAATAEGRQFRGILPRRTRTGHGDPLTRRRIFPPGAPRSRAISTAAPPEAVGRVRATLGRMLGDVEPAIFKRGFDRPHGRCMSCRSARKIGRGANDLCDKLRAGGGVVVRLIRHPESNRTAASAFDEMLTTAVGDETRRSPALRRQVRTVPAIVPLRRRVGPVPARAQSAPRRLTRVALPAASSLPVALPICVCGLRHIEQIVGQLEGEPDRLAEEPHPRDIARPAFAEDCARLAGKRISAPVFIACRVRTPCLVGPLRRRREIERLPAGHAAESGRSRQTGWRGPRGRRRQGRLPGSVTRSKAKVSRLSPARIAAASS
jgi:hypothetical protein